MCSQIGETAKRQIPVVEGVLHVASGPAEKSYLIGSKCKLCGHISFPKRLVCPVCVKGVTMEPVPLNRRGVISLFSVSMISQPGFPAPYAQAYIRLKDGPEVFSTISGFDPKNSSIEVGTEVELVVEKIGADKDGNDIVVHKFAPVREVR